MDQNPNTYPPFEEKLNVISHAFGFGLSIFGLVLLILRADDYGETVHLVSILIFGASMVLLYAASTLYHSAKKHRLRVRLNILDHSAIYVLIAGTYTPFALVTLQGTSGWIIFGVVWGMALAGIILKFFFTGKYQTLSTIMYVVMGWIIVFAVKPLVENLSFNGLMWLVAGGISYTIGAVLFSLDRIKFNHAIFHMFVLFGTFCHFISIYYYVLPAE
ncbi:hemolysin III family protein [Zunongwangia sp. F260]|uniref:Hemolysin III family protein n=2 Tax=Autumnicola TaxID=3160927 RepID=A0ABU3CFF0_9FLAO|nr:MULTISPECIES: hemolysin III family protein [unclassified Zunongwangia]MDT0645077.1 hemolysin III family protein [Zunongwangia sp. F260]MDT0687653.1 hemolysin III family protein [Zunongwangia sp. F225]